MSSDALPLAQARCHWRRGGTTWCARRGRTARPNGSARRRRGPPSFRRRCEPRLRRRFAARTLRAPLPPASWRSKVWRCSATRSSTDPCRRRGPSFPLSTPAAASSSGGRRRWPPRPIRPPAARCSGWSGEAVPGERRPVIQRRAAASIDVGNGFSASARLSSWSTSRERRWRPSPALSKGRVRRERRAGEHVSVPGGANHRRPRGDEPSVRVGDVGVTRAPGPAVASSHHERQKIVPCGEAAANSSYDASELTRAPRIRRAPPRARRHRVVALARHEARGHLAAYPGLPAVPGRKGRDALESVRGLRTGPRR